MVVVTDRRGELSFRVVPETVLIALESVPLQGGQDTGTKPIVGLVRVGIGHFVVLVHVLFEPVMTFDLLQEQSLQDPFVGDLAAGQQETIPIGDESLKVVVMHTQAANTVEVVDVVVDVSDFEVLSDVPIGVPAFQYATGCMLLLR